VDDVAAGASPAAHVAELRALRRLLQLQFVDDLASDEAWRFVEIDTDDPRADAARLCAEVRDGGVRALSALASAEPALADAA
jgi:hypothetical protein